ncbi:hypothetical protein [Novosphingobium cyanobacteriorum]|uniref:Argininosuccinate lyase n=1 Tax=Novosphingobium cyanobacteriorum TaxID=3024215 RepID=A0ABT6CKN8_9SPHN|nr:hypothetical protein [Novosphingobium cyanobacteriorum]MDF8334491.1 hypothetical protein [Novosphingobium cyanobacteriorum]
MASARTTVLLVTAATLALSACGNRRELMPVAAAGLPPAPYGRETKPTADDLLKPPVQAKPQRSVELRSRSQPREDDPFDLPPEQ